MSLARVVTAIPENATPFDVIRPRVASNKTTSDLFAAMATHIENQALHTDDPSLYIANLANVAEFDTEKKLRYSYMASRGVEVVVTGQGMPGEPAPGVRGIPLDATDPLLQEKSMLLIGSHFAGGVFARVRSDGDIDAALCYNRELVVEAAMPLIRRVSG